MKNLLPDSGFNPGRTSSQLTILLHGYTGSPKKMAKVHGVIANALPDSDIWTPAMPLPWYGHLRLEHLVNSLLEGIDELVAKREKDGQGYQKIILVGFSLGSQLAKKIYLVSCGENHDLPFDPAFRNTEPRPWATKVDRLILLAGMNRGWQINSHFSRKTALQYRIGCLYAWIAERIVGPYSRNWADHLSPAPTVFQVRRGSPFLTELRMQWLAMRKDFRNHQKQAGGATVVQLLGTVDDLVSPDDDVDLVAGRDFIYREVPYTGHLGILEMDQSEEGKERARLLRESLTWTKEELQSASELPADEGLPDEDDSVEHFAFIIHGIRDIGHWTNRIGRRVQRIGRAEKKKFAIETSSYGYFPMIQFFLPWKRREKVSWFMDRYAEARARFPEATFHFVGHSHGTYLCAKALRDFHCCRFERVAFAGSVVQTRFPWKKILKRKQVQEVANYVTTGDWVLSFFPKQFQFFNFQCQDLGSAGLDGFDLVSLKNDPRVHNVDLIKGGHSAAIVEKNWDSIAEFIVNGSGPSAHPDIRDTKPYNATDHFIRFAGKIPGGVILLLAVLLASIALFIAISLSWIGFPGSVVSLVVAAYLLLVWWVLNKV